MKFDAAPNATIHPEENREFRRKRERELAKLKKKSTLTKKGK